MPSEATSPLSALVTLVNNTHIDKEIQQILVCGGLYSGDCTSLCPNQDLAGVGVRLAFYFQSFMSALLVIFSPSDSVTTAWTGALLTSAIIIAAFVQKARGGLTLHHATLVLDFATLACIGSLAVAPTLPIWRMTPEEYYEYERKRHAIIQQPSLGTTQPLAAPVCENDIVINSRKSELTSAQQRARLVLSVALLLQVLCQWSWAISLFVWWKGYSQPNCNQGTKLVMFFGTFTVGHHNSLDRNGRMFLVWPIWLLFNVGVTLSLTLILVYTSPRRAQQIVPTGVVSPYDFKEWGRVIRTIYQRLGALKSAKLILLGDVGFFVLWAMFIASSEKQLMENNVFEGDNDFGGFGQITALCVSLAPVWSLAVAFYKYPARRHSMRQTGVDRNATAGQPALAVHPTSSWYSSRNDSCGARKSSMRYEQGTGSHAGIS